LAGDLWILAATVAWVAYSLMLLAWPTALSATERLCCICAGGLVLLLPFVIYECLTKAVVLDVRSIGLIVLAGLLPGLLSYLAYGFMLRELGAGTASLVMYLAPLYGSALAWGLLDETPQWFHGVGALLILPAIYVANRGARAAARPTEE
jgi:drug/metabolite transporter (DMT)-like permease